MGGRHAFRLHRNICREPSVIHQSSQAFLLVAALAVGLSSHQASASPQSADSDSYPLDDVSRQVEARGRLRCPDLGLAPYRGDVIPYHSPIKVHPAFKERLQRFEAVVRDVAIEVYGRAPRRIVHIGAYNCRRIRAYPTLLSEHALGNGIDIAGFDFARLPRGEAAPEGLPRALTRPFKVRMDEHWDGGRREAAKLHQRFLHTLAKRLTARRDIFRVLLGPAWPGHHNHFHFDMAPYRVVAIFEESSG
ncbi:MAG: extensin family protein [Myxococcota bacterium]